MIALLVFSCLQVEARSENNQSGRISRPEKVWSVLHPFKAKKVLNCARRAVRVTDSLEKAGVLTDRNGGQLDAFRHSYWMALMINEGMAEKTVKRVGERHEKGNYIDFRKGKLEDSLRADSMMTVMDLRNNASGIAVGKKYRDGDKKLPLIDTILNEIWNGNLAIMSKNANGEYLDAKGSVIETGKYINQWYIPKVIVNSDMIVVPH